MPDMMDMTDPATQALLARDKQEALARIRQTPLPGQTDSSPTGHELTGMVADHIESLDHLAYWMHTGEGCAVIRVAACGPWSDPKQHPTLGISHGSGEPYEMADRHQPLAESWGEPGEHDDGWQWFTLVEYAPESEEDDMGRGERRHRKAHGLLGPIGLLAALSEWTGAVPPTPYAWHQS
ncbi:hypothetical protein CMI37_30450 [Candidatus Pacearchaeota archaeon]|nr:hypothetical protein [Candidatus Pacearchaeota archaeon]